MGCKKASTPMNVDELLRVEDGTGKANARYFQSIVGGLNYLSHTRPDIADSLSVVARFMHSLSVHYHGAAKRILRYVAGTSDYGIWYSKVDNFRLHGFIDSDYAGSLDDRKHTSGQVFFLGSGAVSWSSKKQDTEALSSSEAEYIAATSSACQAMWQRKLLADFCREQIGATEIFCDKKSAIAMSRNPAFHSRTKHIDVRYHFIRDLTMKGEVQLKHCGTNQQAADILTKFLPPVKHQYFRLKMGVTSFEASGSVD